MTLIKVTPRPKPGRVDQPLLRGYAADLGRWHILPQQQPPILPLPSFDIMGHCLPSLPWQQPPALSQQLIFPLLSFDIIGHSLPSLPWQQQPPSFEQAILPPA